MTKHILVVEDDEDLATLFAFVLDAAGYEVSIATHGRAAVEQLRSGPRPGLILLDLMMPVMDGWEFRAAQATLPGVANIPVIAVSADPDVQGKAEEIRAASFLSKPIAIELLIHEVERVWTAPP